MERTKILVGILLSLASNGGLDSVLSVDSYQWPVGVSVLWLEIYEAGSLV